MEERDYIDATDLAQVRMMRAILREIVAESSEGKIPEDEYRTVNQLLARWERKLHEAISGEAVG